MKGEKEQTNEVTVDDISGMHLFGFTCKAKGSWVKESKQL